MKQRRNKGEGSISKLPNGKYKVVITLGQGIDGKQKRKSVTVATKVEAVKALKDLNNTYRTPQAIRQELKGDITLQEFANDWLRQKELVVRHSTYVSYKNSLERRIVPHIGYMTLKSINTQTVNDLLLNLNKQGLAGSSIQITKITLSNIMKLAVDSDIIMKNPVTNAVNIGKKVRKSTLTLPTKEKLSELLIYFKDKHYEMYVAVVLELATGLRKGELLGLKWSNVDFENNIIHIKSQRTAFAELEAPLKTQGSIRSLYVNPSVIELLKTIEHTSDFVIDVDYYRFTNRIVRTFKKLGFDKHITFHDLRHYHATELIRRGVNVKVVSKRLGHTSIQTTLDLYVHYLPSMDLEVSKIIGNEFIL